jgi:transcription termination/antitermination protein NusG
VPRNDAQWSVLWTHSNCERRVGDQLTGKGFEILLPTLKSWSRRGGAQTSIARPMFPGYLFVRHAIDKRHYIEMLKAPGVVRMLGDRWDSPAPVPDDEIDAIRRVASGCVPVFPHAFLIEGQRVRIADGALAGLEGILIATKPQKGLLVVSVHLLQRSVAVEVESTQVEPVAAPAPRGAA